MTASVASVTPSLVYDTRQFHRLFSSKVTEMDQSNPGGDPDMRVMFTFIIPGMCMLWLSMFWLVSFHMSEGGVATFSLPSFDWLAALA